MHAITTLVQRGARTLLCLAAVAALAACSSLPTPPPSAAVYDFGSGASQPAPPAAGTPLPPLALADVDVAGLSENSTALYYRLAYANDQQLRPYTRARWSRPPAQLLQQALAERLGRERAVLWGDDGLATQLAPGRMPTVLRVQLQEFDQVFASEQGSSAVLRLRAQLNDAGSRGETLVAQRLFTVRRAAATPDAAGGARALAEASVQLADELAAWVHAQGR